MKGSFKELIFSETGEDFAFRTLHLHTTPIKRQREAGEKEREHSEEKMKLSEI